MRLIFAAVVGLLCSSVLAEEVPPEVRAAKDKYETLMARNLQKTLAEVSKIKNSYLELMDAEIKKLEARGNRGDSRKLTKRRAEIVETAGMALRDDDISSKSYVKKIQKLIDGKIAADLNTTKGYVKYLEKKINTAAEEKKGSLVAAFVKELELAKQTVSKLKDKPEPKDPPKVRTPARGFDWEKSNAGLTYSYSRKFIEKESKGGFSYFDDDCTKLLDGVVKPKWGTHSVGWREVIPPTILFTFKRLVTPKAVRIHLFGIDSGGGVSMTNGVKIYAGKSRKGRLAGEMKEIPNKTGWYEIPIKVRPLTKTFQIQLSKSNALWAMLDEVEFK